MPPRQGNKWKCEQVGDHKDYKRSSNVHNQKISEYHAWYMNEQKKKAVFEPNSTAVGVNNLSQVANQVGFAICANVTEKAEIEDQKRNTFDTKHPNTWSDSRQKEGHQKAKEFAWNSASDHKEQGKKHRRASQSAEVYYPPGHNPMKWLEEIQQKREADAIQKDNAHRAQAKMPLSDADGFQTVIAKKRKGPKR